MAKAKPDQPKIKPQTMADIPTAELQQALAAKLDVILGAFVPPPIRAELVAGINPLLEELGRRLAPPA